mmetsp:Transcript_8462/g.21770  ORF Transcript_8462/g.21770 Transcript_8462/m.21770 type:complete len:375 (+) Transcript_8462:107-1231(+)
MTTSPRQHMATSDLMGSERRTRASATCWAGPGADPRAVELGIRLAGAISRQRRRRHRRGIHHLRCRQLRETVRVHAIDGAVAAKRDMLWQFGRHVSVHDGAGPRSIGTIISQARLHGAEAASCPRVGVRLPGEANLIYPQSGVLIHDVLCECVLLLVQIVQVVPLAIHVALEFCMHGVHDLRVLLQPCGHWVVDVLAEDALLAQRRTLRIETHGLHQGVYLMGRLGHCFVGMRDFLANFLQLVLEALFHPVGMAQTALQRSLRLRVNLVDGRLAVLDDPCVFIAKHFCCLLFRSCGTVGVVRLAFSNELIAAAFLHRMLVHHCPWCRGIHVNVFRSRPSLARRLHCEGIDAVGRLEQASLVYAKRLRFFFDVIP